MELERAQLLIRLAQDDNDKAMMQLAQARQVQQGAQEQLDQLQFFLADYTQRAEAAQSVTQLRTCRDFLGKLNEAIQVQQRVIKAETDKVAQAEQAWRDKRQKLESFKRLAQLAEQRQQRRQQIKEQQLTDEFVSNAQIRAKR